jgi:predicted acylesterase/phospholipase RssA
MVAKTALVLSAGGMFGAYQAGVWRELAASGFQPDLVVGTSVGALNGWAIAGGCPPDELIRAWTDPLAGAFLRLRPPLARWRGLFDDRSFSQRIQEWHARYRPRIPIGIVLTDLARLRPRLVQTEEITWRHLAAACAIPLGLPPAWIDGRCYVDGGLLSAMPLWPASEMGASRAVAVNALPELPSRVLRAGVRTVRWISPQTQPLGALEVITIVPAAPLGTLAESVRWNRETILRWIEQGAGDARRALAVGLFGRDSAPRVLQ